MSLRVRLLGAVAIIALGALAISGVATYSALRSYLYSRVDSQLGQATIEYSRVLINGSAIATCAAPGGAVSPQRGGGVPGEGAGSGDGEVGRVPTNAPQTQGVIYRVQIGNNTDSVSCPAYLDGMAYSPAIPGDISGLVVGGPVFFTTASTKAGGPMFRVEASALGSNGILIISQPLAAEANTLQRLLYVEATVALAAMGVALLGGWYLVNRGLAPLAEMERTAESIAEGLTEAERVASAGNSEEVIEGLSERVPGENLSTEVGRLAGTLNSMLKRIEVAFKARVETEGQLRQFVADASHELRTPIAAISAYAELFDRGGRNNSADLERLMTGIRSEAGRMGRLVRDLLLLARLDEGEEWGVAPVELSVLCAESAATAQMVGPGWPVEFETEGPVYVAGDEGALRQVIDNLLTNVRAHTMAGTHCLVRVGEEADTAVITVGDDGGGIAPERLSHVFERFWREDPSRSRNQGGSGLGLAIVHSLVTNQGGIVSAASEVGRGTVFTIKLPLLRVTADSVPE